MKIVHIITRLLRAGSEENTILSCVSQVNAGHEVFVVHGRDYDASYYGQYPLIRFIKATHLSHPISPFKDWKAYIEVKRIFRQINPDIVHTHQSKAGIVGRFAAHAAKVRVIINGVHIVPFASVGGGKRLLYKSLERAADRVTDFHIDVSGGVKEEYLNAGIGTPGKHRIIHSGFNLDRFRTAIPLDWRAIPSLERFEARPPVVVMVAALEARKRHLQFLDAVPKILSAVPDAQVLLLGGGPEEKSIRSAISEKGLSQSVHLLGYRTDPERVIALADVCCLVSEREGLPRVIMQYAAAGKPTVATFLPGLGEVLTDDVNAIVLPQNDINGAADMISGLLLNDDHRMRLAQGARETDLDNWRVEVMCQRILELYEDLSKKLPKR
ncbi:glycosyltransferase [Paracoccus sp. IB05]|uniref:glycosyltransferase n=1 Tax=Paracoccus sp. IB05 TaxID=2779367 RepID=UPI0018E735D9|nr:glycosyltransferase [Paracoccus sp. IB05]MBJ2152690.1 glycosyltransferase [Paracoccus sp. IB05]